MNLRTLDTTCSLVTVAGMKHFFFRPLLLFAAISLSSCQAEKSYFPVHGKVLADGKPAQGATVVFHPMDEADAKLVKPSAVVQADGSFAIQSYLMQSRVVKEGAPAGQYLVTFTWYPPNLQEHLGSEKLPDKLEGKYADPKASELKAVVEEKPTELPPFQLELPKE